MQRLILGLAIILLVIGLSGCGGSKVTVPFHDPALKVGIETTYIPKFHKIHTAEIGASMFEKKQRNLTNEYIVSIDQAVEESDLFITGSFYTSAKTLGLLQQDSKTHWKCACTHSEIRPYHRVCLYDSNNDSKFDKVAALINDRYANLEPNVPYKLERAINKNDDPFKYLVLYQGKKGNTITVSYREFLKDMARPAFTQNISYELEPSGNTTIGFKGLRIEVVKATNFNITYKIIEDYH